MKLINYLKSYGPMLSAVLVIACVSGTLSGYAAPVYEVAQSETYIAGDQAGEENQKTETPAVKGEFDLADGIYEGKGVGFKGTVSLAVEIKDKSILAVNILSHRDDEAFFNRSKKVIDAMIQTQKIEVDVISGATYSSKGIINGVKNALTGEVDNSSPAGVSAGTGQGSASISVVEEVKEWKDGTFYGSATGFAGPIQVKVNIVDGRISEISVVSTSDGSSYISSASAVIDRMIASQSTNVDTVSGATYSSVGIIKAVRNALAQASTSGENPDVEEGEKPEQDKNEAVTGTVPYKDGIYYGTGEGYVGDITLAVVIQDHTIKAILITENEDDEAFFSRAKTIINDLLKNQNIDLTGVDVISGATYSSNGILEALKEAFTRADEITNPKPEETENETETETETEKDTEADKETDTETGKDTETEGETEEETPPSVYIDGDYKVTVPCEPDEDEDFDPYQLSMKISIRNDRIIAITDIVGDGDEGNSSYIKRAANGTSKIPGVVPQIVQKGMLEEIDTVSRATCTSKSIIAGCYQVLMDAKRPVEE